AVAHDLVDGALVAVDRLHHPFEHRIEELACLLGIAVSEKLHRSFEVSEQYRHLLALALQGSLGGEDLLGEVLGGVALGRGEGHTVGAGGCDPLTALEAKLCRGWEFASTVWACLHLAGPALQTELRIRWIVVLAPRTFHKHPMKHGRSQQSGSLRQRT